MSHGSALGWAVALAALLAIVAVGGGWLVHERFVATPAPDVVTAPPSGAPSLAPPPSAEPKPENAYVIAVQGGAEWTSGSGWKVLAAGDRLAGHETIRTGEGSQVDLRVGGEESRLILPEWSELRVVEVTRVLHRFKLSRGRIVADYKESGPRVLRIEVGDAVAEAQASRFNVLGTSTAVAVAVESGTVDLSAAGSSVRVGAGQQSTARVGQAPSLAEPIPVEVLLKVARLAAADRLCSSIEGVVRPGAEVRVGEQVVEVAEDGRFKLDVPRRKGVEAVKLIAREVGGATKEQLVACRGPSSERPRARSTVRIDWNAKP